MIRTKEQEAAFQAAKLQDIATLLRLSQILNHRDPQYLATETLVSVVRHHTQRNSEDWERMCAALDARLRAFAAGFVGKNLKWPQLAKDPDYYKEELAQSVWEELLEDKTDISCAECVFGVFFARKATDHMRKEMRRGRTDSRQPNQETSDEEDPPDEPVDNAQSEEPTPEEHAAARQLYLSLIHASDCLTEQEKLALDYHYLMELPIESVDSLQESVKKKMKLSAVRIRQILRSAEKKLRTKLPPR